MIKISKVNILILFLSLQFMFAIYMTMDNLKCNKMLNKIELENVYLKQDIKLVKEYSLYHYVVAGKGLKSALIFKNRVGDSLDLKHFIKETDYLLCIPRQTCPSCFENILQLIPRMREKLGDRLKLVCVREDVRSYTVYSQVKGKNEIVFYTNQEYIFQGMENIPEDVPFVLRINPDGNINSLFVINKEDPEYLFNYFDVLSSVKE